MNLANAWIPDNDYEMIRQHLSPRDRDICTVLYCTGYRLDDVMHLRRWQLSGRELRLRERKTGKERCTPLPSEITATFKKRLSTRKGASLMYAFPALRRGGKGKMHRTTFWRHFMRAVKIAGLDGRGYSPHSLRKCYAVNALRRLGSLEAVRKDMNHANISVTVLYALSDVMGRSERNFASDSGLLQTRSGS